MKTERFYVKWSDFYHAYIVCDRERKNPEGNHVVVAGTDRIEKSIVEAICCDLNDNLITPGYIF
jgi:hypothetical protein